ncbi:MAG: host specificity factor TipJ family phage tail protein [Limnohabitans sp.]
MSGSAPVIIPRTAHCVTVHDPFHPHTSRQVRVLEVVTGDGIVLPLRSALPVTERPFIVLRNGQPVLREEWDDPLAAGDLVAVVHLPQGGGGEGSNPLRIVLMLAVMVYAPVLASELIGINGAAVLGSTGVAVVQAGVAMAGMALVNAVIPPPKLPSPQQAASLAAPSPTYNLQAQGNLARLDQAIPVQYGRVCAYPDFAAQPYVEYAGNEQYLYQLLCLGLGEFDIEAIRIEDTPVNNFLEIDYEIVPPGAAITKFPTNVVSSVEVSGQELMGTVTGTYDQSGTTITVTRAAHGFAIGRVLYLDFTSGAALDNAFSIASVPTPDTFTVVAAAGLATSGDVTIQHFLGGYVASGAGTAANTLGLDFILSRGLYYAQNDGSLSEVSLSFAVEARQLNDLGSPITTWTVLGTRTYSAKTTTPQRYSERFNVTAGRYEVRVRRLDAKQTDTRYGHEILWGGLRAYLPESRRFENVTLIAMRMRASNNLSSQASRKINVICTRKIPVWNGNAWSDPVANRSIAWALADACRNTVYGAKLPDARLDLAGLKALDDLWTSRGDEFNARFDAALNFWEAITKIAQTGRAKPYMLGGVVRIARDGPQALPVALFSMRNIVKGSFSIDYLLPSDDSADSVEVAYWDKNYWASRRVSAKLPDSQAVKPARIELFGVTDRAQAWREGVYQAASNRYRRRLIKFTTEMEGFIPAFGDLIAVQHDMPGWGQFAEVRAWDVASRTLTLSEPLGWNNSGEGAHYIGLRTKQGGVDGPYEVTPGANADQVILQQTPSQTPYTGGDYERTQVAFGWAQTWRQLAKVVAIRPRGLYQVEVEAINEDPSVHTAESGQVAPAVQTSQLTTLYTTPLIADLTLRSSTTDNSKALLTWTPAPGAETYQIEMAAGVSPYATNLTWTRVGETSANNFAVTALYGVQTLIRVRGVGLTAGPWVALFYGSSADYMWVNDAALMWATDSSKLMWRY